MSLRISSAIIRITGAVSSGRKVSCRSPLSSKLYNWAITPGPDLAVNKSSDSKIGVCTRLNPLARAQFSSNCSNARRRFISLGVKSRVPRGRCTMSKSTR